MTVGHGASRELGWAAVCAFRMGRQGLVRRAPADAWPAVVERVRGLHAQVQSSAELTLWARVDGLDPGAVSAALWADRSVEARADGGTLELSWA